MSEAKYIPAPWEADVKKGTELIAQYMGIAIYQTYEEMQVVPIAELGPWIMPHQGSYYKSWDSLMPVIEKICQHVYEEHKTSDQEGNVYIEKERAHPRTFGMIYDATNEYMFRFNKGPLFEAPTLIEAAFQAVVEWIERFNESILPINKKS
jgi:hypothetical protein